MNKVKITNHTWRVISKDEPSERIKDLLRFATRIDAPYKPPLKGQPHGR